MRGLAIPVDDRILTGIEHCEDAAIVRFPAGKAMVQTLDFFTPIINDPYRFGQIAAANSLSDVYAMGGIPYSVMNIVCFPSASMDINVLHEVLRGGLHKINEAGALLVGGHSVQDKELKYGLSVTGVIDPSRYATNAGLRPGDLLILTKPLGSGVLATAIKADWNGSDVFEAELYRWASRLNRVPGEAIALFELIAATDVTGFGLGGHLLEMARASDVTVRLHLQEIPLMDYAHDLAGMGLVPAGSYANRHYCESAVVVERGTDMLLIDLVFDAQTSGGLVLAVPKDKLSAICSWLVEHDELAVVIGEVESFRGDGRRLILCQS